MASGWHIDETQCGAVENCLLTSRLVSGLTGEELKTKFARQFSNLEFELKSKIQIFDQVENLNLP